MKKLLIFIFTLSAVISRSQSTFKTGVNFPFYTPTAASIDHYLSLVNQSGGKSIRQMTYGDVFWKNVEPTNDNWAFSLSDSVFYNPYSLTPIGTLYSLMGNDNIGLQVPWLACSDPFSCYWDAANDSLYAKEYVLQTVNRYKEVTKYWEIANEIESAVPPKGLKNLAEKKDFLKYNYQWIKSADPTAIVLLPGLVGTCCTFPINNSFSWLTNLLNIGGGNYFDIMNYHDYNAWWTLPAHYDKVQNILNQYNVNKPIWITETSVSSMNFSPITPKYSSVNEQAADVWRRICLLWAKGAEVVLWHSNWSSNDLGAWGEFGLVSNQGIKKKSFHSYKLLNDKISDFNVVNILSMGEVTENNQLGGDGIWALHFEVNGKNKWVIWSPNNLPYTLSGISSNQIEVTEVVPAMISSDGEDVVFTKNTYPTSAGTYKFDRLTSLPILVEESTTLTSIDVIDVDKTINIYPNPSNSKLNIEYSNSDISVVIAEMVDILGRVVYPVQVYHLHPGKQNWTIDVSNLPSGLYFYCTYINGKSLRKKVVIDRP